MAKATESKELTTPTYNYSGFEDSSDLDSSDITTPLIEVVNSNSRWLQEEECDAKVGDLVNTATGETYPDGIAIIPLYVQHVHNEWVSREEGGGLVGVHSHEEAMKIREGEFPNFRVGSNSLVETYYLYSLDTSGEIVVPFFSSTKISPFKRWYTASRMFKLENNRVPLYANQIKLSTVKEQKRGYTFFNIRIMPLKETRAMSLIDPGSEFFTDVVLTAVETAKNLADSKLLGASIRKSIDNIVESGDSDDDIDY